jgi:hypothetical protein
MSRGNNRSSMYQDVDDRRAFYGILGRAIRRSQVLCHGDVLMGNHFHLFLEGAMADISVLMWRVNHQYALAYNARHERINHLVGQRFRSSPVADLRGARAVSVYIALNPVRAGFCAEPAIWAHGSLRAHLGIEEPREHLTLGFTRELFADGPSLADVCADVARTPSEGRPSLAAILPEPERLTRDHVEQAIRIFGYAREEIARHYDVAPRTLRRWLEHPDR